MNEAAVGLVGKAKNRMQKFYNPTLYKAPPKKEMSMEDKIMQAGSFPQIDSFLQSDVAPPPAPEMPSGAVKKNEKSAGVIGMMDMIIKDLENGIKDMEYEEKTAQDDYAELMADSQATRKGDTKALTGKTTTKAETEDALMTAKETRSATATDLKQVQTVIQDLHAACDFIMQNFDLRKEARTNEIELVSTLHNLSALLGRHCMGNFNAVLCVVHQEHLKVLWGVHHEFVKTIGDAVLGAFVGSITDVWHDCATLELPSHAAINTPWLPPGWLHGQLSVLTSALEALCTLLHNLTLVSRCGHGEPCLLLLVPMPF